MEKMPYDENNIVATTKGWAYQPTGEVLVAVRALSIKADLAIPPTFTAAVSYSNLAAMVTGDILTVTLTASEGVVVTGTPTIYATIGLNSRNLVYSSADSTDTSLVFNYTIAANDSALAGGVVIGTSTSSGSISDAIEIGSIVTDSVSFTAPDASLISVN